MYTFLAGPAVSRRRMGTKRYLKLYYDQIMSMVAKFMHCWRNCRNTTVSSLFFLFLFCFLNSVNPIQQKWNEHLVNWFGHVRTRWVYFDAHKYIFYASSILIDIVICGGQSTRFALQWSHSFECVAVFRIWCIGNAINAWTVHIHFRFSA